MVIVAAPLRTAQGERTELLRLIMKQMNQCFQWPSVTCQPGKDTLRPAPGLNQQHVFVVNVQYPGMWGQVLWRGQMVQDGRRLAVILNYCVVIIIKAHLLIYFLKCEFVY